MTVAVLLAPFMLNLLHASFHHRVTEIIVRRKSYDCRWIPGTETQVE